MTVVAPKRHHHHHILHITVQNTATISFSFLYNYYLLQRLQLDELARHRVVLLAAPRAHHRHAPRNGVEL